MRDQENKKKLNLLSFILTNTFGDRHTFGDRRKQTTSENYEYDIELQLITDAEKLLNHIMKYTQFNIDSSVGIGMTNQELIKDIEKTLNHTLRYSQMNI